MKVIRVSVEGRRKVDRSDPVIVNKDDRAMFGRPDLWCQFPYLPLKHRVSGELGYLEVGKNGIIAPEVHIGLIFCGESIRKDGTIPYSSMDAIYADGWRVD